MAEDTPAHSTSEEPHWKQYIGRRFRRTVVDENNPSDPGEIFEGKVAKFDPATQFFECLYDDGDVDDCPLDELLEILVDNKPAAEEVAAAPAQPAVLAEWDKALSELGTGVPTIVEEEEPSGAEAEAPDEANASKEWGEAKQEDEAETSSSAQQRLMDEVEEERRKAEEAIRLKEIEQKKIAEAAAARQKAEEDRLAMEAAMRAREEAQAQAAAAAAWEAHQKEEKERELLAQLKSDLKMKEEEKEHAVGLLKRELESTQAQISQATRTAIAHKKEKVSVRKQIEDLSKGMAKVQQNRSADEQAAMRNAQEADEALRAQVRKLQEQSEEEIAHIKREAEAEVTRISRIAADKEEAGAHKWRNMMDELKVERDGAYRKLHAQRETEKSRREEVAAEYASVELELQKAKEQWAGLQESNVKKFEVGSKMRLDLEEERVKANQRTMEKIAMHHREIGKVQQSLETAQQSLVTMREDMVPLGERMTVMGDQLGSHMTSYKAQVEAQVGDLRKDVLQLETRLNEDITLFTKTIQQDVVEIKKAIQAKKNATQSSACVIA